MNSKQQKTVDRIKATLDKELVRRNADSDTIKYEVKTFEVDDSYFEKHGLVFVYAQWGIVGDEGTFAAAICRESVHFRIGPRGGTVYMVDKVRGGGIAYKNMDWYVRDPMRYAYLTASMCERKRREWREKHKMA